jgi:hypothetical protein
LISFFFKKKYISNGAAVLLYCLVDVGSVWHKFTSGALLSISIKRSPNLLHLQISYRAARVKKIQNSPSSSFVSQKPHAGTHMYDRSAGLEVEVRTRGVCGLASLALSLSTSRGLATTGTEHSPAR